MKNIIQIILLGAFMLLAISEAQAQKKAKETRTIEFQVSGVCGMCKDRIENGALIKGVKQAEYDRDKSQLKVIYRSDKVTEDEIHQAIADIGHDTDKVKAIEETYNKLPGCCAYRDEVEKH
jgi:copper chaperone CopZ